MQMIYTPEVPYYFKWSPMKTLLRIVLLMVLVAATSLRAEQNNYCGVLDVSHRYGPFDYTNASHRRDKLSIVERAHFTPNIRDLISGKSGTVASEISYTLHAFPNHHIALQSMSKLSLREKKAQPLNAEYSIECYFDRAFRFQPRDGMARMLYANYLLKVGGRKAEAFEQYQIAIGLAPENANINYNIGLVYLKNKNYEQAIEHAKKAYNLGFPLPGLRNKLMKTGKWDGKLEDKESSEADGSADEETGVKSQE